MKTFQNLKEVREGCPFPSIVKEMEGFIQRLSEEFDVKADTLDFEEYLGGSFNIVETEEDLDEITTYQVDPETGNWGSIRKFKDSFDDAYLTPDDEFAVFYSICNNAGGPTYYVPRSLFGKCPNIEASIKLSNYGKLVHRSLNASTEDYTF